MPETASQVPPQRETNRLLGLVLGRRRQFVVDWRYQLRVAAGATAIAAGGFALLMIAIWRETEALRHAIVAADPDLGRMIGSEPVIHPLLVLGMGVLVVGGVFGMMILESHRTAGAAVALRRALGAFAEGSYDARVNLRRGDHLRSVQAAVDDLGARLATRSEREEDLLRSLAERLAGADPDKAQDVARELDALAEERRTRRQG